ncbi:CobW family GTP-binding protein [Mesorhizobium sp. 1B3]|uniref:CobW family GTP-binding protein n=1 Tax=Mesorhizobium sp. 1B3 TaxID=3243599 RepID=UPI003D98BD90
MTTPVLVITGFLGAGKTTLINNLLAKADGRRIAAVVNDFGAINIDEELISGRADAVIGLANGCICCTMQGDLLRTLKLLLARDAAPDHIVIEASGVADPSGIIQALSDPVLWKSARLDAVVCVVDAPDIHDTPSRRADDLWRAQLSVANFIVLSKTTELAKEQVEALVSSLSPSGKPPVFDPAREPLPSDVFFDVGEPVSRFTATPVSATVRADRFTKLEWQTKASLPLEGFQSLIAEFAPSLVRAKGILRFRERPGQGYLLQMVGYKVTLEPTSGEEDGCRLVMIGERGRLASESLQARLDALLSDSSRSSHSI